MQRLRALSNCAPYTEAFGLVPGLTFKPSGESPSSSSRTAPGTGPCTSRPGFAPSSWWTRSSRSWPPTTSSTPFWMASRRGKQPLELWYDAQLAGSAKLDLSWPLAWWIFYLLGSRIHLPHDKQVHWDKTSRTCRFFMDAAMKSG